MKNLKGRFFVNMMLALFVGIGAFAAGVPVNPFAVAGGVFGLSSVGQSLLAVNGYHPAENGLNMAIQKEIWTKDLIDNLFRDNPFLAYCFNADQYVMAGKVVHIPVAGAKPTVVKNRSSLPASVTTRTDTEVTYVLDEFTTDPITIPNADTVELSYDKRQNVMSDHSMALNELIGDDILIKWVKATGGATTTAGLLRTTGSDVLAHLTSATGNRKKFIKEDLKAAQVMMNKANIAQTDRYALIDSEMMSQLLDDATLKAQGFTQETVLKEGKLPKLYGFNLIERSYVITFDNASTPAVRALGFTPATSDNAAVICWQKNAVERAIGDVKFFEDTDNPTYYGDIYSGLMRAGGRIRRAAGVVTIVQAAGS